MPAMTIPEPTTWFSPSPQQFLLPISEGGYVISSGEQILSAEQILSKIYPHPARYPLLPANRDPVVVQSAIVYANSLHNPAATTKGPWKPTVNPFVMQLGTIEPLINHSFWKQLDVLAAPLSVRHRFLPIATSVDLLVRFRNGSDIGIGMCQTNSPDQLSDQRVAAELGAAIALLNDTYNWWPQRAFVLFCANGKTTVELINVDEAVFSWLDALDLYRFMSRTFHWENPL